MAVNAIITPKRVNAAGAPVRVVFSTDNHVASNGSKTTWKLTVPDSAFSDEELEIDGIVFNLRRTAQFNAALATDILIDNLADATEFATRIADALKNHPSAAAQLDTPNITVATISSSEAELTVQSLLDRPPLPRNGVFIPATNIPGQTAIEFDILTGSAPVFNTSYAINLRVDVHDIDGSLNADGTTKGELLESFALFRQPVLTTQEQLLEFALDDIASPYLQTERAFLNSSDWKVGLTDEVLVNITWWESGLQGGQLGKTSTLADQSPNFTFIAGRGGEFEFLPRQNTEQSCPTTQGDLIQDDYLTAKQFVFDAEAQTQRWLTNSYRQRLVLGKPFLLSIFADPANPAFAFADGSFAPILFMEGFFADGTTEFASFFAGFELIDCATSAEVDGLFRIWHINTGLFADSFAAAVGSEGLMELCVSVGSFVVVGVLAMQESFAVITGQALTPTTGSDEGGDFLQISGEATTEDVLIDLGQFAMPSSPGRYEVSSAIRIPAGVEGGEASLQIATNAETQIIDTTNVSISDTGGQFLTIATTVDVNPAQGEALTLQLNLANLDGNGTLAEIREAEGSVGAQGDGPELVDRIKLEVQKDCAECETLAFVNQAGALETVYLQSGRALEIEAAVSSELAGSTMRRRGISRRGNQEASLLKIDTLEESEFTAITFPIQRWERRKYYELMLSEEVYWLTNPTRLQPGCFAQDASDELEYIPIVITSDDLELQNDDAQVFGEVSWRIARPRQVGALLER